MNLPCEMKQLTPTQQKIVKCLPATADELAMALYRRSTQYERRLIYVHISLLRHRLNGAVRIGTRRRRRDEVDGSTCRVVYVLEKSFSDKRS